MVKAEKIVVLSILFLVVGLFGWSLGAETETTEGQAGGDDVQAATAQEPQAGVETFARRAPAADVEVAAAEDAAPAAAGSAAVSSAGGGANEAPAAAGSAAVSSAGGPSGAGAPNAGGRGHQEQASMATGRQRYSAGWR